jgi:hypothetical protein
MNAPGIFDALLDLAREVRELDANIADRKRLEAQREHLLEERRSPSGWDDGVLRALLVLRLPRRRGGRALDEELLQIAAGSTATLDGMLTRRRGDVGGTSSGPAPMVRGRGGL